MSTRPSSRRTLWRRLFRLAALSLFGAAGLFALGLTAFAHRVLLTDAPADPPQADAIVALTGGGGARLSAAVDLLEQGLGARLLISGVHPQTRVQDLIALAGGEQALYDCCIDLGRVATTTAGNAEETADWARNHGWRSVIVVTSDYHMPRAMMELNRELGDEAVRLHPRPTPRSTPDEPWWRDGRMVQRLAVEYAKYLAITARNATSSETRIITHRDADASAELQEAAQP